MQKSREERARSAAQKAADELAASRRGHYQQVHEATPRTRSPRGGSGGGIYPEQQRVQESARTVMGVVRGGGARGDEDNDGGNTAARGATAVEKVEGARLALAGDAVERKGETDESESAWQLGQAVRRRAAEKAQEEAWRVHEPSEEEWYVLFGKTGEEDSTGMPGRC